jgi:hypothetical protein
VRPNLGPGSGQISHLTKARLTKSITPRSQTLKPLSEHRARSGGKQQVHVFLESNFCNCQSRSLSPGFRTIIVINRKPNISQSTDRIPPSNLWLPAGCHESVINLYDLMAPSALVSNGTNGQNGHHEEGSERTITVMVTGFGPFQDKFPINPSFEIAKSLPESLPPSSRCPKTTIRIIPYSSAIRVCYEEVRQLLPKLHDAYDGQVDLVLHIGMASGRKFYCAERYGRRDGYIKNKVRLPGNKTCLFEHRLTP